MKIFKKFSSGLLAMIMMFSTIVNSIGTVSAFTGSYSVRQYTTGYQTDTGTDLIRFRVFSEDAGIPNYEDSFGQWAFCVQHGAQITNGNHQGNFNELDQEMIKAARIAYLGFYSHSGWFGSLGAAGKLGYARTQMLIWQVLGQASNSYNIDPSYPSWKSDIMDQYNKWDTRPSFDSSTLSMDIGSSCKCQL